MIGLLGLLSSLAAAGSIAAMIPFLSKLSGLSSGATQLGRYSWFNEWIDRLPHQSQLLLLAATVLGLHAAKCLTDGVRQLIVAARVGQVGQDIRLALATRLLTVPFEFFLKHPGSRLIKVQSHDSWYCADIALQLYTIANSAVALCVFGAALAWLDWRLCLLVLIAVTALRLLQVRMIRRLRVIGLAIDEQNNLLMSRMVELVDAVRTIRLFGQEPLEAQRYADRSESMRARMMTRGRVNAAMAQSVEFLLLVTFMAVLLTAYARGVGLPSIAAFLLLLYRAQPALNQLNQARLDIAGVHGSVAEVEWLLSQGPRDATAARGRPIERLGTIRFDRVSYTYPNGGRGIENASLELLPGQRCALIGRSGAGKSTIVNLLLRLVEPGSGAITHEGNLISELDLAQWRRRIVMAGQDADLVEGTIAQNIAYGRPDTPMPLIVAAAVLAGADRFIAQLPQGYECQVGSGGTTMSGGQRQRIGLARALIMQPDLLVLDEATSAVDTMAENEIMTLLRNPSLTMGVLVVSHRRSTIAACDTGIVVADGHIVEQGRLRDLDYFSLMEAGNAEP